MHLFLDSAKSNSFVSLYNSAAIFLFSAVSLVVPSGYSYGPLLLFIGGLLLFHKVRQRFSIDDWLFVGVLFFYFVINSALILHHDLPVRHYDNIIRVILAIPVYFLLIRYPPQEKYFWLGLVVGALGAGVFAVFQIYTSHANIIDNRANGFIHAIQFGDISLLTAGLVFCGGLWHVHENKFYFLITFFASSLLGLAASLLSSSRGGWLAIPLLFLVYYLASDTFLRKKIAWFFVLGGFVFSTSYIILPETNFLKKRVAVTHYEINAYFDKGTDYTSVNSRVMMWQSGLNAFKYKPILGWGDLVAIKSYFPSQWSELNKLDNFNHLHNEYIDALAKKGLVGFTALMALYLIPLYYFIGLMRTRQADVMPFAAAGVVLIVCVMTFGLTQCFLAHNSGTTVFVFYLVIIKAYCRNIVAAREKVDDSAPLISDAIKTPPI
jgi:O-antigen ligase